MQAAMRPYVTAGAALLGAGVIAVTPIAPTALMQAKVEQAVRFAAASVANIPANLALTVVNTPANELAAINSFADSLFQTGTWWVYTPTNVLGTDPADPPKLKSSAAMALPFGPGDQTIGQVLGDQMNIIQEAELPMNAGCTAIPEACSDPNAILSNMFQVPLSQLMAGYDFGTVINPTDGQPVPWSNTTVQLDPLAPVTTFVNNLMQTPGDVKTVSAGDVGNAGSRVLQGLWVDFYPFVPGSEIFNPNMTYLAYVFRPLAPVLCGCDEPFIPPTFGTTTLPIPALDPAPSQPVSGGTGSGPDMSAVAAHGVDKPKAIAAKPDGATAGSPARSAAAGSVSGPGITNAAHAVQNAVNSGVSALTAAPKPSKANGSAGTGDKSGDSSAGPADTAKSNSTAGKHH